MRFIFALFFSGLLLVGCAKKCKLHSDCSASERCVANECTVLCRTDRDCDGLGSCISGECTGISGFGGGIQPGGGGGGSSGGGAGGGGGSAVDAGMDAGTDAGTDAGIDAGPGGGSGGGSGGGMGGGAGGGTGGGGGVDAGFDAGLPDAGTDAGIEDAGSGMGVYGDACNRGGDCASGLCVGNAVNGLRMCTITCGSEAACDETHACLPVQGPSGGTINICIPSDSGQPCANGMGSSCIAGICLLHPSNTSLSVCATPCETTHACPNGFSCSVVQVGSQMRKVCSPVGSSCSAQGTSNQCISRFCSALASSPGTGICTGNCSVADDCPTGWACGLDDDLSSRCQPVGMMCTVNTQGNNNCFSKACLQGTPLGDYCVPFCQNASGAREPARCPAGWNCIDGNDGMGTPLWVCSQ